MTENEREGLCQSLALVSLQCEETHAKVTEAMTDKQADIEAYVGLTTIQHMVGQLLKALQDSQVIHAGEKHVITA